MSQFFQNHWDKVLTFVLSIIVGAAVAFSAARIGIIDRIESAKSSVAIKVEEVQKELHKSEKILERIDVKVSGLEEASSDAKLDRREIINRMRSLREKIIELRVELSKTK